MHRKERKQCLNYWKSTMPDELRKKISSEVNLELLRRWHKIAAKSTSIEEFLKNTVEQNLT